MNSEFRIGTLVDPQPRISRDQIDWLHAASCSVLDGIGIICFNEQAVHLFDGAGCRINKNAKEKKAWTVKFPEKVIMNALESVPRRVVLGARDRRNRLLLDNDRPMVYFGTGSETNITLKSRLAEFVQKDDPSVLRTLPIFTQERGSIANLCRSAKLCNQLDNVDFFIRNVNLQDQDINLQNKDVNVFMASLMYMTKHVQAGLTNIDRLDDILKLAALVAGGESELKDNPILSFITCLVKSPLQMVDDTTEKLIAIARKGIPLVVSSSPQGGSTAPIREEGMVALINAEILAGITLTQLVHPGTPVLYGAVPVRARLDNLHDLYSAAEFIHYNIDCIQLARHYGVPCYSTAGVGDAKTPGMQATVEKMYPHFAVAAAGAQYIHYALGLLDKTNVFCPLQAVLDDAHIGVVRQILRKPSFDQERAGSSVVEIEKVMGSSTRLFSRYIRKAMREGVVSSPYPFESRDGSDEVLCRAQERLETLEKEPCEKLDTELISKIYTSVAGLVPIERFWV